MEKRRPSRLGIRQWDRKMSFIPGSDTENAYPLARESSDLDKIVPMEWPSEWSREFHTLLATLTWLIHLEPQQEALLDAIVAGPVLTVDDLLDLGVVFPSKSDRKPQTDDVST